MNRRLIVGERIMYADGQVSVNCTFTATIKGALTGEQISAALLKLQTKHPLLRANIKHDNKGFPSFVMNPDMPAIPVCVLERYAEDQWEKVSVAEWIKPFDAGSGPLARLVWLRSENTSDLIFVCAHCICDGTTIVTLMREFLQSLDEPETRLTAYQSFTDIQELLPDSYTQKGGLKFKAAFFSTLAKGLFFITNRKPRLEAESFYFLNWNFPSGLSSTLVKKCKAENTSVHAVLCAAFLQAFAFEMGNGAKNKVISPVDIRRYIPDIKKDTMFAFAPIVELSIPKKERDNDFWTISRSIKNDLVDKANKINMPEIIVMSEFFHSTARQMIGHLRSTKGSHDVTLSNMGVLDIPTTYQTFSVEALHSPAVGFPWRNPNTLVVSTFQGKIDFSFCSNGAFLPVDKARDIRKRAVAILSEEIG
ncbi:condensation domain-containing protein [Dyadobacter sp. LHD-138]|uniref:condensation domain-containing protein n=1 Tax=Dyadobacter sp. LHD-138 TaxID=3071413 RepID=UPI0027E11070|nr:condensation domain-containing protein [Dyadobacter sp. LHD-138]MDQ6481334.1 condensation domain-containing protein [Dyadobacter sp. LHD-138]